jgi:hypothetical protein
MNTVQDQDSSSWIQRKFLHPSVGASAQNFTLVLVPQHKTIARRQA